MSNYTSADLAAIDRAIAKGIGSYTIAGRTVTFRSLDEMMRVREHIQRQIAGKKKPRVSIARTSRGC